MRLALDWGEARIGVAACDTDGLLAYPVTTVKAGPRALDELVDLVAEFRPAAVVVGLPRTLAGADGPAAVKIRRYAERFAMLVHPPVFLVDERFTTVTAARQLHAAGRSARQQRAVIDQAAAVAILEHTLEVERHGGRLPLALLSTKEPPPGGSGTEDGE